jgi:uncharacterized SAM-binding protein YcdF (DUF218 family)
MNLTWIKAVFLPGTVPFLILGLILGVVLLQGGAAWASRGRRWLIALALGYWMLSVPRVAGWLADRVAPPAVFDAAALAGSQAIVVLDAGAAHLDLAGVSYWAPVPATVLRALEAARVDTALGGPMVFVTGGAFGPPGPIAEAAPLRDVLIALGVPAGRIVLDSSSTSTRMSALTMRGALAERGITRFVLVTSASHMPRALAAFREVGLAPLAAPAPWHADADRRWLSWSIVPSADALAVSQEAIYELAGRVYYRARGWTGR